MKIRIVEIPKLRDASDFELVDEDSGSKAFMTVTGPRTAVDKKGINHYLELAKNKFSEDIKNKIFTPNSNVRYCFYGAGDFTKTDKVVRDVNLKFRVSQYGNKRLHIEIPQEFVELFIPGEEISIVK